MHCSFLYITMVNDKNVTKVIGFSSFNIISQKHLFIEYLKHASIVPWMLCYLSLKCILKMIKFLVQIIDRLIICSHWKRLASCVDPIVWSSLSTVNNTALIILVFLLRNLLGTLKDDKSLITVESIHGFLSLLLSLSPLRALFLQIQQLMPEVKLEATPPLCPSKIAKTEKVDEGFPGTRW